MTDILAPIQDASGMVNVIAQTWDGIFPTNVPDETGQDISITLAGNLNIANPSLEFANEILQHVVSAGAQSTVPLEDLIRGDFSSIVDEMGFVDASTATTEEGLNDMVLENPVVGAPWTDKSDREIGQYDPLFVYRRVRNSAGNRFAAVANIVTVNRLQLDLYQAEKNVAIFGASASAADYAMRAASTARIGPAGFFVMPGGGGVPMLGAGGTTTASDKRVPVFDIRAAELRARVLGQRNRKPVDSIELEKLRRFASLTPSGLWSAVNYLGAVTQISDASNLFEHTNSGALTERKFNYAIYNRAKIANIFTERPTAGEQLFFKIAKFPRDQLLRAAPVLSVANLKKRGFDTMAPASTYIGAQSATADAVVQIRGFSSSDGQQYMGDSTPLDSMKPDVADHNYVESVVRFATEYRPAYYDAELDTVVFSDELRQEGLQEAIAQLPDGILENIEVPGIIVPVGTVKQKMNRPTTNVAIANACVSQAFLAAQPHIEIYCNT